MSVVKYIYEPYRLDWGQIMAFAYEYIDAQREWHHYRAKHLYADARTSQYRNWATAEFQLWGIANALGIPMYVLALAAKVERKYHKRGNWRGLDYQRLIVGLDANRKEYDDE